MSEIKVPDSKSYSGPFLISKEGFKDLASKLEDIWEALEERGPEIIRDRYKIGIDEKTKINEKLNEYREEKGYYSINQNVEVKIDADGRVKEYSSLSEVLMDKTIDTNKIQSILIRLRYLSNEFILDIRNEKYMKPISYRISTDDNKLANDITYYIDGWIEAYKPSLPIRIWSNVLPFVVLAAMLVLFLTWVLFFNDLHLYQEVQKEDVINLIESGVNENNINEAVTYLLERSIDYVPQNYKSELDVNISVAIGVMIILTVGGCPPKTALEIGKNRYKFWSTWSKLILVIIPSTIVIPYILSLF